MWPLVADVPWSVCLLDITVSSAKTAETIEMSFAVLTIWTRVGPRNHVLDGACTHSEEQFFEWTCPGPFRRIGI